jgi:hypothetical protein
MDCSFLSLSRSAQRSSTLLRIPFEQRSLKADVNQRNRDETSGEVGRKRSSDKMGAHQFTRALFTRALFTRALMRKVFLWAAALTVGGLMLHGAFACELNRKASQPAWAIALPDACSGSNCLVIAAGPSHI